MTKHAKKSEPLQLVDRRKTATVKIPVPFLGVVAAIEHSFFDLCIEAGRQVLDAMMEQDREALCGPRWQRDPDRRAGRAGTTPSGGHARRSSNSDAPAAGAEHGGRGAGAAELRLRGRSGPVRHSHLERRGVRRVDPAVRPESGAPD